MEERSAMNGRTPSGKRRRQNDSSCRRSGICRTKFTARLPPRADLVPVRGGPLSEQSAHTQT